MISWKDIDGLKSRDIIGYYCDCCGKKNTTLVKRVRYWLTKKNVEEVDYYCSVKCALVSHCEKKKVIEIRACKFCGKEFEVNPNNKKQVTREYCSQKCCNRDNSGHSEETKARISRRINSLIASGQITRRYGNYVVLKRPRGNIRVGIKTRQCIICNKKFQTHRRDAKYCSEECRNLQASRNAIERIRNLTGEARKKYDNWIKAGRKGGYGKVTIAKCGIKCRSKKEARFIDFLVENRVSFVFEPPIPESPKFADVAILHDKIIFVEMDGLRRDEEDSRFSWDEKIELYEKLKQDGKLDDYLVVTPRNFKRKLKRRGVA